MKISPYLVCAILLLLVSLPALSAQQAFEFHRDARMQGPTGEPVRDAYAFLYVATDKRGHGVIQVMFSNGTALDNARFNAQLSFLDADGRLLRQESFSHRIEAAGSEGAREHRLSKLVDLTEFESLQVKFFLSDIPGTRADSRHVVSELQETTAYLRTSYSGN